MSHLSRVALVLLFAAPPVWADAVSALKCERAVATAFVEYAKARTKIVAKCQDASVASGDPASPTSCPTTGDDAKLQTLEAKLRTQIAAKCGGANKTCSAADVDADADEPLAAIGWDVGVCPAFGSEGCVNPIADCDDVATCVACIAREEVASGTGIAYHQLVDTEFATGSAKNLCQRALGKETVKYLATRDKLLAKCWDAVTKGSAGYTDPPGCPATDPKLPAKLARAEQKKVNAICKACGAGGDADGDLACDAGPGFDAATIGFEPDCPAVIVPSSMRACDQPGVTTLAQMITCVDCVAEYASDCGATAVRPGTTPYSVECPGP